MSDPSEWLARGREIQKKLWGARVASGGAGPPGMQLAPEFFEWVAQACFGGLWSRPGLALRDRSLVTVAQLAALGKTEELRGHLIGALAQGLKREELLEVLMQTAAYAADSPASSFSSRGEAPCFK